jgi:hypothetical protein
MTLKKMKMTSVSESTVSSSMDESYYFSMWTT